MRARHLILLVLLSACGPVRPIVIRSDPNEERSERVRRDVEEANLNAFISEHPEFDYEIRKGLRDGTISRDEALERARKLPKKP